MGPGVIAMVWEMALLNVWLRGTVYGGESGCCRMLFAEAVLVGFDQAKVLPWRLPR